MVDKNQSQEQVALEEAYQIANLETLKVIADEKRLHILELLIGKPYTVKQLAAEIGIAPTKLYYHVKQLEDHGLIVVVETQVVSGIIEKTYRARARRYSMDPDLLPPTESDNLEAALSVALSILDKTKSDLKSTVAAGGTIHYKGQEKPEWGPADVSRRRFFMTVEQAEAFHTQLSALLDAQPRDPSGHPDEFSYHIMVAFYPMLKPQEEEPTDD